MIHSQTEYVPLPSATSPLLKVGHAITKCYKFLKRDSHRRKTNIKLNQKQIITLELEMLKLKFTKFWHILNLNASGFTFPIQCFFKQGKHYLKKAKRCCIIEDNIKMKYLSKQIQEEISFCTIVIIVTNV